MKKNMNSGSLNGAAMPQWYAALGELDLEIVASGFGRQIREWKRHTAFDGDNFYRLYLPVSGKFRLEFEARSWDIVPGAIYLVPPKTPFAFCPETPSDHYWIHFFSRKLSSIPSGRELQWLPLASPRETREAFRETLDCISGMTSVPEAVHARNKVFSLLAPLLEKILTAIPDHAAAGVFAPVLDYVDDHLAEPMQVEDLRRLCAMGRAEFSARFREAFGIPPKQYIVLRRLRHAKHLLWRTRLPVKEIAQQCGFADMRFFCRSFKKAAGQTPGAYRRTGEAD